MLSLGHALSTLKKVFSGERACVLLEESVLLAEFNGRTCGGTKWISQLLIRGLYETEIGSQCKNYKSENYEDTVIIREELDEHQQSARCDGDARIRIARGGLFV